MNCPDGQYKGCAGDLKLKLHLTDQTGCRISTQTTHVTRITVGYDNTVFRAGKMSRMTTATPRELDW